MSPLKDLPSLSQTVKDFGLSADKKLGQHFLLDMNVTDRIARLLGDISASSIAEIGPGPGGLTRALLQNGAREVLVIEMDERFIPVLDILAQKSDARLKILHGNALKVGIPDYLSGEIKIAANLPYNVGTQMLTNWLTADPLFWSRAVLMFQKEVAERIAATPDSKAYGRLAVLAQSVCQTHIAFDVPARVFSPPPKVDSAVIVLDPLPEAERFEDLTMLAKVTQAAFGQRRKMLRGSLKSLAKQSGISVTDWLEGCGIDPTRRAETLSVAEFQTLTRALKDQRH